MRHPRPDRARTTALSLAAGALILAALPLSSAGNDVDALLGAVDRVTAPVVSAPALAELRLEQKAREQRLERLRASRRAEDPKTQPPLHGSNPHGQGTVGAVDLSPTPDRPTGGDPDGSDAGEEVVIGRARGEQRDDGTYHGHITILALFGNEILGVDTNPGETQSGPLNAIQQGILTPLCNGSGNQICITAVQADSQTTNNGSSNRFSAAHATVGGPNGIDVGAAESNGNISEDGKCQTAHGDSSVASVKAGGQAVADAGQSSTDSKACKGQPGQQTNTSRVAAIGGTGVPLPAAGCGDGTPDTVTGIPTLAPIICNGDDASTNQAGAPYGARDALTVYLLADNARESTAASESAARAPKPQCSDARDNDGDGKVDAADPGCLSGPGGSYNPNDDDETDPAPRPQCSDTADNDGDGVADSADPGCLSGPGGTYDPNDDDERDGVIGTARERDAGDGDDDERDGAAQCADGRDNDGDGVSDRDDPGCLSGPGGTYDPNDDDESDSRREAGSLPMTGTDVLLTLMAGLLMLGGGAELRRRVRPAGRRSVA